MTLAADPLAEAPASASARGYLTRSLPAVYRDPPGPGAGDTFAVRWMRGLEEVLDPTVTLVDNLAWHLHPDIAPAAIVRLLLGWLGLQVVEDVPIEGARRVLMRAEWLARRRGTLRGLRELLRLAFPEVDFELAQQASFTEGDDPGACPLAPEPYLEVRCRYRSIPGEPRPLPPEDLHLVHRVIEGWLPVAVPYILHPPG